MSREADKFIQKIRRRLDRNGVKLDLVDVGYLFIRGEKVKCMGYFDPEAKIIKCATRKPESKWLPVLVHEYAHFTQWKEQCYAWTHTLVRGEDRDSDFFEWVQYTTDFPRWRIKDSIERLQLLELDCEKRAVKTIKQFGLSIDRTDYVKKANAYLYFYSYSFLTRKWYTRHKRHPKPPYYIKEIYDNMPTIFRPSYIPMPQKYFDLFDKHYS